MSTEAVAKIAGVVVGFCVTYWVGKKLLDAGRQTQAKEKAAREKKVPAVEKLIDDLEVYGEHVAKRIYVLKGKLGRNEITLDQYNVELIQLTM